MIGSAGGAIPEVNALEEVHAALIRHVQRGLRPVVTSRYPLEQAADALRDLDAGLVQGKAVLVQD
ncbi:zinc-binding dehydrogenase [Rhodococcus sp. NCIMB 12038]|uniref:zinc-binding dehydrogenase n=1 Tax=Rhodococcus sp. NCIMB 12038 TaxID=933800 RepID=UPI00211B2F36|nr:zinc-binding dehydrogenase [Rhodococcus sp. NCIMB 12038]